MSSAPQQQAQPPSFPKEESIIQAIKEKFGGKLLSSTIIRKNRVKVNIDPTIIKEAAHFVKEMGFDHIHMVTGTDYPQEKRMEVTYALSSIEKQDYRNTVLLLATNLPRDNPKMPTLIPIWPGAEYHEREEYEMLGITFEGHPNLTKLLLPEDWNDTPPLRKDFKLKKWHEWERAEHGLVKPKEPEKPPQPTAPAPTAKPAAAPIPQPAAPQPKPQLPPGVDANALDGLIKLLDMRGSIEITQATSIVKLRTKQEKPDIEPYIKVLEQQGKAKREGDKIVKTG